jgi:GWxTD domain-containing protein
MIRINVYFRTVLTAAAFGVFAFTAAAQPPSKTDPSQNPRKIGPEMRDAHKKWIANDVPYIITGPEKRAFLALKTDEERENFIARFWNDRDPDPETEENEFRDAYYERIAYANEHFTSGIPGWKTDRGRIYIMWDKPDSVESHPAGGSYDRPATEGGGSTTTYPFETWFYRHLEGVGEGVEIEFVDRSGTGEYKLARDLDEKDALATGARARPDRANMSIRVQDSPLARNSLIGALETPPKIRFSDLDRVARGDSGSIDNNPLDVDVRVDFFRESDERVITTFTAQTNNEDLQFKDAGGLQTASLNILGRVTAIAGNRSGIFEDSVTTSATTAELIDVRGRRSIYQKALALTPGTYKVTVVVRDVNTGNRGIVDLGFTVPRYDAKKFSTSSLILTAKLRSAAEREVGQMFVIGDTKVIPNLAGVYKKGQEAGIYMQLYNAGIDQTTLRPAVDVEYVLNSRDHEVLRQKEDWSGLSESGSRLTLARLLPTANMPAGDYDLTVIMKDRVSGQTIENKGKFSITP